MRQLVWDAEHFNFYRQKTGPEVDSEIGPEAEFKFMCTKYTVYMIDNLSEE